VERQGSPFENLEDGLSNGPFCSGKNAAPNTHCINPVLMSAIQRKKPASASKREPEPTERPVSSEQPKSGGLFMLAFNILTWGIVLFFVSSYLITDTWTWGYRGKWVNVHTWIPVSKDPAFFFWKKKIYHTGFQKANAGPDLPIEKADRIDRPTVS
jgi:hypothetical protein